ncbi:hypothetical protein [Kitasatospora sp. NPDC089509]|uniref:hypothetical protein n=1 Tax=Kitasatospora sp. NPDC089509 TaxID=3364079 RepID=UPI00381EE540
MSTRPEITPGKSGEPSHDPIVAAAIYELCYASLAFLLDRPFSTDWTIIPFWGVAGIVFLANANGMGERKWFTHAKMISIIALASVAVAMS